MCKWHGGTHEGNVPVRLAHPRKDGIQTASVDPCIQSIVQSLNDAGLQTLNSCCGHGIRPGWVAMEDGRHILIAADHAMMRKMSDDFPALDGDENWLKKDAPSPKTYDDGLEAAALYLDNQAKYTEITDLNRAKMLSKKAAAIRALKE